LPVAGRFRPIDAPAPLKPAYDKEMQMEAFFRRSDPKYQEHLADCMTLDGPKGLIATAEPLDESVKKQWPTFNKSISVDFLGFTATTLLDPGGMITKNCHFDKLEHLIANIGELNEQGVAVRIRLLLIYPYSAAGQIRIQAEHSAKRTSIERPDFKRGISFIEQLTDETFFGSSLFSTLQRSLKIIYDEFSFPAEDDPRFSSPNKFALRFSSFNPIICGLRVNSRFFFDVYSYAKHKSRQQVCSGDTQPVIEVDKQSGLPYESFCDHFRYIWRHDATLDAEDAVDISSDDPRLRAPEEIDFRHKTRRIVDQAGLKVSELEAEQIARKARRVLIRHCPPIRSSSAVDVAFLGCAWRASGNAPAAPNKDADELGELWRRNFVAGELLTVPRIDIKLVEGVAGRDMSGTLYEALREATIGIIVLSAEHSISNDNHYDCTPNVYHELGFLMAQVPKERTFVFKERRVRVPTNVASLIWIEYEEGKICLSFLRLIEGLRNAGVLGVEDAARVAEAHCAHLVKHLESRILTVDEFDWAKTFLRGHFMRP
jgi:hypothetical protein